MCFILLKMLQLLQLQTLYHLVHCFCFSLLKICNFCNFRDVRFSSVQSLSRVWLFATAWTAARQASLSITNYQSLLKLTSIESVMPSNHLILCRPLLLLPSIFPSIGVFSNESILHIRWPMYWSFSFSISPSSEYSGLISFRMVWLDLFAVQGTLKSLLHYIKTETIHFPSMIKCVYIYKISTFLNAIFSKLGFI